MKRKTLEELHEARKLIQGEPRQHDPNRVAKYKCATCPWRPDGLVVPDEVMEAFKTSPDCGNQYCHAPAWQGKPEDVICRGHRDHWAQIFYQMGVLDAPTDEAWEQQLNKQENRRCP